MIEKMFMKDENYEITNYGEKEGKNIINIKSKLTTCQCPKCKEKSSEYHGTYIRNIQDTPTHNCETWLNVSAYEFVCNNDDCDIKTFTEELSFARKNKVKTDALIQLILSVSMFLSSTTASLVLSFMGVKVSADAIDDIIKNIKITDDLDIEEIGIDDVAIRKGMKYATAIYDMKDHHLIALLDGRDVDSVEKWLSNHKKIKLVARDRASAYAAAISKILPECVQVADRYHLFENLIKYLKEIFYNEVPEKIFIENGEIRNSKEIKKITVDSQIDEEILNQLKYDNSQPIDDNGNEIYFDNKRRNINSKQYIEQEKRRVEKMEKIKKIRSKLKDSPDQDMKEIADEFEISTISLKKYSKMSDEDVENIAIRKEYKKRVTIMDDYINMIYKMIVDNIPYEYIIAYIVQSGYSGSIRSIKTYIMNIARNNNLVYDYSGCIYNKYVYPDDVLIITRYELLKYLLTIDESKKNKTITEYINIIFEKYPIAKNIQDIFTDFHKTIFSKDSSNLDLFIDKYCEQIPSFCNGLKKDIAAVKNAISLEINSGFVEGNNNKFKLIKRIVYGKSKLCNLFKKSYLCFLATTDNFDIETVVESVLLND